jgi:hypothetical protein
VFVKLATDQGVCSLETLDSEDSPDWISDMAIP